MNSLDSELQPAKPLISALEHNPSASRNAPHRFVIMTFALFLALLAAAGASDVESTYLKNYPYFCEPISYMMRDVEVFLDIKERGQLAAVQTQFLENGRHPLRQLPAIIFAPNLLASASGHMVTAGLALLSFLLVLGFTVYHRTNSLWMSAGSLSLLCAVPGTFSPTFGFGAYFLDYPAALTFAAAGLCLLNFGTKLQKRWLFLFGIFASVTALARYTAGYYIICFAGPPVLWLGYEYWKQNKNNLNDCLSTLFLLTISCLPGVAFLMFHLGPNMAHYSTYGYALNAPLSQCFAAAWNCILQFMGLPIFAGLIGLTGFSSWHCLSGKPSFSKIQSITLAIWCPLSVVVFVCLIVRAAEAMCELVYLVPALFVMSFGPESALKMHRRAATVVGTGAITFALVTGLQSYLENKTLAQNPSQATRLQKTIDSYLGALISNTRAKNFVDFTDSNYAPLMESFYSSNGSWYPQTDSKFTIHKTYYATWFPQKKAEEIAETIYAETNRNADVILVFADPNSVTKQPRLDAPVSQTVARYVSQRVKNNAAWLPVKILPGPFGPVTVYRRARS